MDKAVDGFDYTLFIGPDNKLIGKQAGEEMVNLLGSESGTVLEICGNQYSQASKDKSEGFASIISKNPHINMIEKRVASELRDDTEDIILSMGKQLQDIDVIFAHNDYMALGAHNAVHKMGYDIKIIGIDGFNGKNDGINLVRQDKIYETIACSTGGKEAIQYALDILKNVSGVPKQIILRSHGVTKKNVETYMANLDKEQKPVNEIIDVGYSQVGTESAWRLANTKSIKDAAKDMGINLLYEDANQSQKKQIEAVRKFIDMKVDVIVISPVVDNGWDEILQEAKKAGIPVLLSDRKISTEDDSLFTTYIGADFIEEGRRAMRWIKENVHNEKGISKILEIQGTLGASPTVERNQGFEEVMSGYPDYKIVYSKSGDFTYEGGKKVIEEYLQTHEWDIDAIFAHNDDMALGSIEALEANGIKPGVDVSIVSVDGTRKAFEAMIDKKLNCVVECSPLLGPQLMKAVQDLMSGKELPLRIITEEKVYTQEDAKSVIRSRKY
jgi:simple sugar transport system substrate-binding protein